MSKARAIGIDLGTTCSAISYVDELGRSAMFRDPQGQLLIPSMVFFEDDELVFGNAAKQAASTQPNRIAEYVKRDLGQAAYSRAIDGELLPVAVVEGCLLKKLGDDFSAQGGPRPAIVLAMPACFDQAQREALLDAARIAGLDVLGTITDTLAAALAFAELQGYVGRGTAVKPSSKILVFDLGGGMLDVAIVEVKPGRLRTLAVRGDVRLGGRDWDQRLADTLAGEFEKQFSQDPRYDMASVRRLMQAAEEAKQTLSARQQARVRVERSTNSADVTVTRQMLERATADLLDRGKRIAEQVLAQAGLEWRDLSHLLMVGGASRMPMIGQMLESLTGMKPVPNLHPDEALARGAALYAERLLAAREKRASSVQVDVTDLTARNLGVEWTDPGSNRAENVVIIARGTELPCGTASLITTQVENQNSIVIQLLEGDSRSADECSRIGRIVIRDLPAGLPKNWPVEVRYQCTPEGRLQVQAHLQRSGEALAVEWQREGALGEERVAAWQRVLGGEAGLRAIHAQLALEQQKLPAASPAPMPVGQLVPDPQDDPAIEEGHPHQAISESEMLERSNATAGMLRKRKHSPRNLAIILAGYVFSSLLGLAIGYYILMWLRPEFNYWHLTLPGLTREARPGEALSPTRR
ncbi:MAG TPA: Hsp70 family protein [Pirellulales bacterium]|jgi:molecular chaperone DnaK|nr:Hsp70 family protein [Pirellulales bacterium]